MSHSYTCSNCGRYIDVGSSFCENVVPKDDIEKEIFVKQRQGGFGYGICVDCWTMYDDIEDEKIAWRTAWEE